LVIWGLVIAPSPGYATVHWPIYPCKMVRGGRPLLRENLAETDYPPPPPFKNADLQSIFAHSASDVTPSEKSSINTNRKSTKGFPRA